jgi:peptidoglycan/LPS O-acetylase OafA/YrhL
MPTDYIRTLDGWRAIAIMSVILYHSNDIVIRGFSLGPIQAYGDRGVQLFFAISGLLICSRLLIEQQRNGRISIPKFYLRRIFRIQPAAFVYLGLIVLLTLIGVIHTTGMATFSAATSWRNLYGAFHLRSVPGDGYTSHFWSLAIEEHFYLILPAVIVLAKKRLPLVLGVLSAVFVGWSLIAVHYGWVPPGVPFWRTDLSLEDLFVPSFLAAVMVDGSIKDRITKATRSYGLLALVCVAFVLSMYTGGKMMGMITCFGFPVVVVSTMLHPFGWLGRLLETLPFKVIGRWSYSIYLWQQLFTHMPAFKIFGITCNMIALAICAGLSYYFVEKPMIKLGHRLMNPVRPRVNVAS